MNKETQETKEHHPDSAGFADSTDAPVTATHEDVCPKCRKPVTLKLSEDGQHLQATCTCTKAGPVIDMPAPGVKLPIVPGLSAEAAQDLDDAGLALEDLAQLSDADLLALPHVGTDALAIIRQYAGSTRAA